MDARKPASLIDALNAARVALADAGNGRSKIGKAVAEALGAIPAA